MLGRNHALWGAAGWTAAWPALTQPAVADTLGMPATPQMLAFTGTIAAGAAVLPDLDHPDARPARHFGILTRIAAKAVSTAAGGHRMATHSATFAVALAAIAAALAAAPGDVGRWTAAVMCGFCCSLGVTLIGPSLGLRIPPTVSILAAAAAGWGAWAWHSDIRWVLPVIAAYGVLIHIACDFVTVGGVPLLWPFTRRKFAVRLFRVGGKGETVAALCGTALLGWAAWNAVS